MNAMSIAAPFLAALISFACHASPIADELNSPAAPCEIGVYSDGTDTFITIVRDGDGHLYRFSDGVSGTINTPDSRVSCHKQAVKVDGDRYLRQTALSETNVQFDSNGTRLSGRLIEPPTVNDKTPLVIFAHGSEPDGWLDSFHAPYQMVGRGVSVFVYDKRGTGQSDGSYTQNFPRLADDLIAASQTAKQMAEGRFDRFGLIGLSQGGWIAPLAAEEVEADFIGIGYGLVADIREEDAAQVALELTEAGYTDEVLAKAKVITDATATIVTTGYKDGLDQLEQARIAFANEPWFATVQGEYTGIYLNTPMAQLRAEGVPFLDALEVDFSIDPVDAIRQVKVPQMWALAGSDREAPIALTLERLINLRAQGQDIDIHIFPGTDHGMWEFEEAPDGSRTNTKVTEGFYDLMADWAKNDFDKPYGKAEPQ